MTASLDGDACWEQKFALLNNSCFLNKYFYFQVFYESNRLPKHTAKDNFSIFWFCFNASKYSCFRCTHQKRNINVDWSTSMFFLLWIEALNNWKMMVSYCWVYWFSIFFFFFFLLHFLVLANKKFVLQMFHVFYLKR